MAARQRQQRLLGFAFAFADRDELAAEIDDATRGLNDEIDALLMR